MSSIDIVGLSGRATASVAGPASVCHGVTGNIARRWTRHTGPAHEVYALDPGTSDDGTMAPPKRRHTLAT